MEDKKPIEKNKPLNDEQLDAVAGGKNPFNPKDTCNGCGADIRSGCHVVTENGIPFYVCDSCHTKFMNGELHFFSSVTPI